MRIILDSKLSVEKNAERYFERAKKARKKLVGTKKAIASAKERLKEKPKPKKETRAQRKKEWYEKYRWFISSDDLLCIGGRDATTNETIVKKHADKGDVAFHTDMSGSPFVIVKAEGAEVPKSTLDEAAQFTACYSKAWKKGMTYLEVFYVEPDQLSKTPNPGEYLPKGAFMVRGQVNYLKPGLELAAGQLDDGRVMVAPRSAIETHCPIGFIIRQGNDKTSDVAKALAKKFDTHPDEIIPLLPPGGVKLGVKILGDSQRK